MRFTRIELGNWRNFTRVDVELQRRVFLVGPNASGKSNMLDVFRFLRDIASDGGGFQEAVRKRGSVSSIRSSAATHQDDIFVGVDIGEDGMADRWSYELRFSEGEPRGPNARPIIRSEVVREAGTTILERPNQEDAGDPELLTQTHLEQVGANRSFRQVVEFFGSVRYTHLVPHVIRDLERFASGSDDPFGGRFLEEIAATHPATRAQHLKRISEALRLAVPQLRDVEFYRDRRGTPHLRGRYVYAPGRETKRTEEHFSDGTLRLLGLLWTILDEREKGPLLLEEPELSLHPEVVRSLPLLIAQTRLRSGRQILMSTHSRDLLLDEGIGWDEVLMFQPSPEGTIVNPANSQLDVRLLLEGGVPLGDVVVPRTAPSAVHDLALLG